MHDKFYIYISHQDTFFDTLHKLNEHFGSGPNGNTGVSPLTYTLIQLIYNVRQKNARFLPSKDKVITSLEPPRKSFPNL